MREVDAAWDRIERWLVANQPEAFAALRPGASAADLDAVESALGVQLPAAFRASLQRHDGQTFDGPWLVDGGQLCAIADALDEWTSWKEMLDAGDLDGFEIDARPAPQVGGDTWWRPGWIPITAHDGDYLVLDLDPAPGASVGQVFAFSHETGLGRLAAPDFATWLSIWADELEAGVFSPVPEDGGSLHGTEDADCRTWPRTPDVGLTEAFTSDDEDVDRGCELSVVSKPGHDWSERFALLQRVHPPRQHVKPADWPSVEKKLGLALPTTYKVLCDTYGSSPIEGDDVSIELFSPQATQKDLRFPQAALAEVAMLRTERKHEAEYADDDPTFVPVPDYRPWDFFERGRGGLLPWGRDASLLFWFDVAPSRDPEDWDLVGSQTVEDAYQPRVYSERTW